jgi:hypothetical protein
MAVVTTAAIGAGTAIYSAKKSADAAKEQNKIAREGIAASDPLGAYRPKYAAELDKLMSDPSSIVDTPEYKARLEAAQRTMAAQGYLGSGNAIIEAANAGGAAFDQAFNRLNSLAGGTPGAGYNTAVNAATEGNQQKLSAYAGVANNLTNLGSTLADRFNKGSQNNIGPVTKQVGLEPVKVEGF